MSKPGGKIEKKLVVAKRGQGGIVDGGSSRARGRDDSVRRARDHWENGYIGSFDGKFRDEFLNCELLEALLDAVVLTA